MLSSCGEETVRGMLDMEKQKRLLHFHKAEPCRKYPLSVEQRKTPASAEFFAFLPISEFCQSLSTGGRP